MTLHEHDNRSPAQPEQQPAESPRILANYTAARLAAYIDENGCYPASYWTRQ